MNAIDTILIRDLEEIDDYGIEITDNKGIIIGYSKGCEQIEGYKRREVIGKHINDIYHDSDKSETRSIIEETLVTKKNHHNVFITYATGKRKSLNVLCSTYPTFTEDGKLQTVVCTYREISDYLNLMSVVNKKNIENIKKKMPNNETQFTFDEIIGNSIILQETIERAKKIAGTDEAVLIYGETGTGKELFAQSIHNASPRRNRRFVAVNCSAIPETLLESTLFGTCKGSFTGAIEKKGLFEEAECSTLFLDEINSMDIAFQSKLLRVAETKKFRKVGGNKEISCDVRFISAMNQTPEEAIQEKTLRLDLYYRLAVFALEIVPLRRRQEDILLLSTAFLEQISPLSGKRVSKISEDALRLLLNYTWLGNVRELKHVVRQSIYNARDDELSLTPEHLKNCFIGGIKMDVHEHDEKEPGDINFHGAVERYEKYLLKKALEANDYNIRKTARVLKLPRQTLHVKINKYGLQREK